MEENKYYTPDITEFYVDFEYLFRRSIGLPYETFKLTEVANFQKIKEALTEGLVKVPYLSKEDIEEEGFIFDIEVNQGNELIFKKPLNDRQWLEVEIPSTFDNDDKKTAIYRCDVVGSEPLFHGLIRNKSEFKRVLKMIGI